MPLCPKCLNEGKSKVEEMRITVALEGLKSAALQFDPYKPESIKKLQYAADLYKRANQ